MADGYIMRRGGASNGTGGTVGERVTGTFTGNGTSTAVIPALIGKTSFVICLNSADTSTEFTISMFSYTPAGACCVIFGKFGSDGIMAGGEPNCAASYDVGTGTLTVGTYVFGSGTVYYFESI